MSHFRTGGYTFEPRKVARAPQEFGKSALDLEPDDGVDINAPDFIAANFQHRIANALRQEALRRDGSIKDFVGAVDNPPPGISYDRISRICRGVTLMQVADLVAWATEFDSVRRTAIELLEKLSHAEPGK